MGAGAGGTDNLDERREPAPYVRYAATSPSLAQGRESGGRVRAVNSSPVRRSGEVPAKPGMGASAGGTADADERREPAPYVRFAATSPSLAKCASRGAELGL
jgi:hypothetical protein